MTRLIRSKSVLVINANFRIRAFVFFVKYTNINIVVWHCSVYEEVAIYYITI